MRAGLNDLFLWNRNKVKRMVCDFGDQVIKGTAASFLSHGLLTLCQCHGFFFVLFFGCVGSLVAASGGYSSLRCAGFSLP